MRKRIALMVVAALTVLNVVAIAGPASACSEEFPGTACTQWFVCQVTSAATKGKVCL